MGSDVGNVGSDGGVLRMEGGAERVVTQGLGRRHHLQLHDRALAVGQDVRLAQPLALIDVVIQRRLTEAVATRERELVILRAGFNWKSGYEWAQHERIGLDCGLTPAEIARIKEGPDAEGWSKEDAALLQATDELTSDAFITDATWAALEKGEE